MSSEKEYMTRTCAECPWLKATEVGRFTPARYEALHNTCVGGGGIRPIFACHKSPEGGEKACAGFILVHGMDVNSIRLRVIQGTIDPDEVKATGPLYENFAEMAKANGYDPGEDWDDQDVCREPKINSARSPRGSCPPSTSNAETPTSTSSRRRRGSTASRKKKSGG